MMFGFGEEGTTNLITKALAAVGKVIPTVPDATQVFYHLPKSTQFPKVGRLARKSPSGRSHHSSVVLQSPEHT